MRRLAIALLLTACKPGLDERCNVPSDCADGLTCTYPPTWTCPASFPGCPVTVPGGTCQEPAPDLATPIDASSRD